MLTLLGMASCCCLAPDDKTPHDRTVLIYMAAENSLASFSYQDIDEMKQALTDIPKNSRLIIYLDNTELPRIIAFEQTEEGVETKTLHQYAEELNSGDAETLRQVMEWTSDNYPAESYGLVMWSHGDSWIPTEALMQRSICIDNGNNSYSDKGTKMNIGDMADALKGFPKLDFIMFDACFMQSVEVAHTLRTTTRYIVASPAEIPGPGAPYHTLISPMFSQPLDMESLIEAYYQEYREDNTYGVCLSVVDCDYIDNLANVTAEMVAKHVADNQEESLDSIQCYYTKNNGFLPEFYDMNGYMIRMIKNEADYARWKNAFDLAIPYKRTTDRWYSMYTRRREVVDVQRYGGMSCYVPKNDTSHEAFDEKFRSTSWYEVSGWKIIME